MSVQGNGARILIVDDEELSRQILLDTLGFVGYVVDCADSGWDAWEKLDAAPTNFYDLVLLDRSMPGLDGMELLARIRQDNRLLHLPVIMQTAVATSEDIADGIKAGAYYYLAKPLNLKLLLSVVGQAVEEQRTRRRLQDDLEKRAAAMRLLRAGLFRFRTPDEANSLASALARSYPTNRNLAFGLTEMFMNAIEHGNLGISYDEKSRLIDEGRLDQEIQTRLSHPDFRDRAATVEVQRLAEDVHFCIRDEGEGFDWLPYLEIDPSRAFSTHGRGIAMSRRLSFDRIDYRGAGNEVNCTVRLSEGHEVAWASTVPMNIRDMSEDLKTAHDMQSTLLPTQAQIDEILSVSGMHVSSVFRPNKEIGGDVWGAIPLDENRLAIYLADFTGHGVTAALNTFRLDTLIKYTIEDRDKPGVYLTRLNQKMAQILPVGHYCTMLYGVIDKRRGLFTFAAAAAPPPLVFEPVSRELWKGDSRGLPLGVYAAMTYKDREMPFPMGGMVMLFSDALSEARPEAARPIGVGGVSEGLRQHAAQGGALEAEAIVEAIINGWESPLSIVDDLTVLCCQRAF